MNDFFEQLAEEVEKSAPSGWRVSLSRNDYGGSWTYYRYSEKVRIHRFVFVSAAVDSYALIDIQIRVITEDGNKVSRRTILCGETQQHFVRKVASYMQRAFEDVERLNPTD